METISVFQTMVAKIRQEVERDYLKILYFILEGNLYAIEYFGNINFDF